MGIFEDLQEKMRNLEDSEIHDGYWYRISDALVIMICGLLCRQQKIDDIHDWAKSAPTSKFLLEQFEIERIFSRAQFYNLLALVDAEKFKLLFTEWMQNILCGGLKGKTVSIDGKTVCGTDKLTGDGSVLHIASAIVSDLKLVIGSQECFTKTGEINAFRDLVELLDVRGAVVVADALHCKPKSAEAVVKAEAGYLFAVKNNQEALKDDIELFIQNETVPSHQTAEKNGGRIEKRTAYASNDIDWLDQKGKWKNLSCIGAIHREFEKNGQKTSEWHYYISSADLTPEALLTHVRMEWAVESMHWLLDVHFTEDKTRVWDMNVQKILNTARKIALNLIRIYKEAHYSKNTPLTSVLKENLFDLNKFAIFLDFFRSGGKLD
jgi:predicted transposase YbfD/YdcC